jgi:TatA/E family protein of Tat protein translocase
VENFMNLISPVHILFIAAFALIFIGPKRLPQVARSLGSGMRMFRDALNGELATRELGGPLEAQDGEPDAGSAAPAPAAPFG